MTLARGESPSLSTFWEDGRQYIAEAAWWTDAELQAVAEGKPMALGSWPSGSFRPLQLHGRSPEDQPISLSKMPYQDHNNHVSNNINTKGC